MDGDGLFRRAGVLLAMDVDPGRRRKVEEQWGDRAMTRVSGIIFTHIEKKNYHNYYYYYYYTAVKATALAALGKNFSNA